MKFKVYAVLWLPLFLAALSMISCNAPDPSPGNRPSSMPSGTQYRVYVGPVNKTAVTTGCRSGSPWPLGMSSNVSIPANPAVSRGSSTRTYRVHVPGSYVADRPQAVVLVFHGYSGNAVSMEQSTGFSRLADVQGFIAVYPQGLLDGDGGKPFWASAGPIDYGIDEAAFVSNILDDLQKKLCVDPKRIFVTGFSNGGGMSGFLACRLARRIAAFAPISGNFYALPGGCNPGRPVPILEFHGTMDPVVPYNGIPARINPEWPLPSIPQWLQDWAARDGCKSGPIVFLHEPEVTGMQWTDCEGNATVIHYRIEGGGHSIPTLINGYSAASITWKFFQTCPLP